MMQMHLSQMAAAIDGELYGDDAVVSSFSTDTRTIKEGDMFIALSGPNFDGHDHAQTALNKGATAVMVSRRISLNGPQLVVEDTRYAMAWLANVWRKMANPRLIALTGSNGKTTLKEMLAAIMSEMSSTLATQGNLNNDIGVPLTLLRLQGEEFAVVEMGANHPGEIDYLTRMAQPDVAILNNAGRAHLEGFKTVEGVANAKAEIINGLSDNGIFIYNADDKYAELWRKLSSGRKTRIFGLSPNADVRSELNDYKVVWHDDSFEVNFPVYSRRADMRVNLALGGQHNRMNALAAIAAAQAVGVNPDRIISGLAKLKPVPGRLYPMRGRDGLRMIDDTYNANPDSVIAALNVLQAAPGRRTLVLGDLGELGDNGTKMLKKLGKAARKMGIERLYTVGDISKAASAEFGKKGKHFKNQDALIEKLHKKTGAEDSVLIKGSRTARMENVVRALKKEASTC